MDYYGGCQSDKSDKVRGRLVGLKGDGTLFFFLFLFLSLLDRGVESPSENVRRGRFYDMKMNKSGPRKVTRRMGHGD